MESKIVKVNRSKSGSGSITTRIVLPASWVRELELEDNAIIELDKENNQIIIKNIK